MSKHSVGEGYKKSKLDYSPYLTREDLMALLERDSTIHRLLAKILGTPLRSDDADSINDASYPADKRVDVDMPPRIETPDSLRSQLQPELLLLSHIQQDPQLATEWLVGVEPSEGRQLAKVIAMAAQWEQILILWEQFAGRCKIQKRPATAPELEILETALSIHNLIWKHKKASLITVPPGTAFDYANHERGTPVGEQIVAQWLPGLLSAGNERQKNPLVATA